MSIVSLILLFTLLLIFSNYYFRISTSTQLKENFKPPTTTLCNNFYHTNFYLNSSPPIYYNYANLYQNTGNNNNITECNVNSKWSDLVVASSKSSSTNDVFVQPSLFPRLIPPTINFFPTLRNSTRKDSSGGWNQVIGQLKWVRTIRLVNHIVKNMGFKLIPPPTPNRSNEEWFGFFTTKVSTKKRDVSTVIQKPWQKYNLIPNGHKLCHKDKMWYNSRKFLQKFGWAEFPFLFESYAWPGEAYQFLQRIISFSNHSQEEEWIFKPSKASHSKGIFRFKCITDLLGSLQLKSYPAGVIQKYLDHSHSYLIQNGTIRLRVFALVTSVAPLRIYLYNQSEPLINNWSRDPCMVTMPDLEFHSQLRRDGIISPQSLAEQIEDAIIKMMFIGESKFVVHRNTKLNRYNMYQLWSADFIIDSAGQPWLMELNRYADFRTNYKTESLVRIGLLLETLNLVGYHLPSNTNTSKNILAPKNYVEFDEGIYSFPNISKILESKKGFKFRHDDDEPVQLHKKREVYLNEILQDLTPDELKELIIAEAELSRAKGYKRIFPTNRTYKYLKYLDNLDSNPYMYMLQDAWENKFGDNSDSKNRSAAIEFLSKFQLTQII